MVRYCNPSNSAAEAPHLPWPSTHHAANALASPPFESHLLLVGSLSAFTTRSSAPRRRLAAQSRRSRSPSLIFNYSSLISRFISPPYTLSVCGAVFIHLTYPSASSHRTAPSIHPTLPCLTVVAPCKTTLRFGTYGQPRHSSSDARHLIAFPATTRPTTD